MASPMTLHGATGSNVRHQTAGRSDTHEHDVTTTHAPSTAHGGIFGFVEKMIAAIRASMAAAAAAATRTADAPHATTYKNPVYTGNAPDPSITRAPDGTFYAYTTQAGGKNTPVLKSSDMVHWTQAGDAFPTRPDWVKGDMWAPNITKVGGHYNLQYSGRGADGKMRIGQAVADSPAGPFHDKGVLVDATDFGYVIDPYLLQAKDGRTYLYYGSGPEGITAREVKSRPDGTLDAFGDPVNVMGGAGDPVLTEGSFVTQKGDEFYLTYSSGDYKSEGAADTHYNVRVARSTSPLGPFEKLGKPILADGGGAIGPGHHTIITDDAGKDWIVYHAWGADRSKGRQLHIDPIDFDGAGGWPTVNGGAGPSDVAKAGPALRRHTAQAARDDAGSGARAVASRR